MNNKKRSSPSGEFAARLWIAWLIAAPACAAGNAAAPPAQDSDSLVDLSIEELLDFEITSVSRRPERLLDAPASIFVITAEDIRRSGVATLPEALRLAPNLQVARVTASDYAISARGFNNAIGNKLLVLVDGRTIYTPLFSGVFWDAQGVLLEDVDRIEVISGPGASLWGANAVNGVINIITRPAQQTQGVLATARGGNRERDFAFRYGGKFAGGGAWRAYVKSSDEDNTVLANGTKVPDSWNRAQAGFRMDWQEAADGFTWQGDVYRAEKEAPTVLGAPSLGGGNLLVRWNRRLAGGGEFSVQSYVDHSERRDPVAFQDRMDIYDIEFQHALAHPGAHQVLWGAGTRHAWDHSTPGLLTAFIPGDRKLHWTNIFAQDEYALAPAWSATLGAKVESNVYTGAEFLPSLRLAWKPAADRLVWGALSRAVRAPSRIDREFYLPGRPPYLINGGPNVQSEVANVLELGYRTKAGRATWSATAFYDDYDKLRSGQLPPAVVENKIAGSVSGVEAWGSYQATRDWRLTAGGVWQELNLRVRPGSADPVGPSALGNDPHYQWTLRSTLALSEALDFDLAVRRSGALPDPQVAAYTAVDMHWTWRANRSTEWSLTVQNLFDPGHIEFGKQASASELPRSIMLKVAWRL